MQTFNFWKENKIDGLFTLNSKELKEEFIKWLASQNKVNLQYIGSERTITHFIGGVNGLNSMYDEKQYLKIVELLKPVFIDYCYI